jgi:hypothetical protein
VDVQVTAEVQRALKQAPLFGPQGMGVSPAFTGIEVRRLSASSPAPMCHVQIANRGTDAASTPGCKVPRLNVYCSSYRVTTTQRRCAGTAPSQRTIPTTRCLPACHLLNLATHSIYYFTSICSPANPTVNPNQQRHLSSHRRPVLALLAPSAVRHNVWQQCQRPHLRRPAERGHGHRRRLLRPGHRGRRHPGARGADARVLQPRRIHTGARIPQCISSADLRRV